MLGIVVHLKGNLYGLQPHVCHPTIACSPSRLKGIAADGKICVFLSHPLLRNKLWTCLIAPDSSPGREPADPVGVFSQRG